MKLLNDAARGHVVSRAAFATLVGALTAQPLAAQFNALPTIAVNIQNDPAMRQDVDTEGEYVPNVVFRENGLASFEALKAQAVAARTFAYYKIDLDGFIGDGQNDQVFSGPGAPSAIHFAASQATEGEILYVEDFQANDILIASFYVAGAIPTATFDPSNPSAIPAPGAPSTGNTQQFVTYPYENNLSGGFNQGSTLGFQGTVSNPNWPNRGAKSQNGADYLSDNSISYVDILKYFYGADIQLRTATTAGSGVQFGVKELTDFDDYGSGRTSDGTIDGNEGFFSRSPTFSGSTTANAAGSTAERSSLEAQGGTHSQLIDIVYDESSGQDFLVRHLSGARFSDFGGSSNAAARVSNLQFEAIGSVGFWLKTDDPGLQVSLAIDDPTTGDRGVLRDVIADGQWHKYEWFLETDSDWEAWIAAGNGAVDGELVTIDSIQFLGSTDAQVFLDTVFWDPAAVFDPAALGDFDGDGLVTAADYSVLRGTASSASEASSDHERWSHNFGAALPAIAAVSATVPEPCGHTLLVASLVSVRMVTATHRRGRCARAT